MSKVQALESNPDSGTSNLSEMIRVRYPAVIAHQLQVSRDRVCAVLTGEISPQIVSPEEIEAKAREDLERDLQMYLDLARYSGSLRNHQIAGYDTGDAELSSALKEIFLPLCFQKIYTSKIRHSMDVDTVNLLYILLDDAESHIVDKNQQGAILSNLSNTLLGSIEKDQEIIKREGRLKNHSTCLSYFQGLYMDLYLQIETYLTMHSDSPFASDLEKLLQAIKNIQNDTEIQKTLVYSFPSYLSALRSPRLGELDSSIELVGDNLYYRDHFSEEEKGKFEGTMDRAFKDKIILLYKRVSSSKDLSREFFSPLRVVCNAALLWYNDIDDETDIIEFALSLISDILKNLGPNDASELVNLRKNCGSDEKVIAYFRRQLDEEVIPHFRRRED